MIHQVSLHLVELSALLGAVQPPFVALLKQDRLPKVVNTLIAVLFSLIVAVVTCATQHQLTASNVVGSLLAVYLAASAAYHGFWQPTGIEPKIQSASSL